MPFDIFMAMILGLHHGAEAFMTWASEGKTGRIGNSEIPDIGVVCFLFANEKGTTTTSGHD